MRKITLKSLLLGVMLLTTANAMAIDFPKIGRAPVDGGSYVLVNYARPNLFFSRTSWDGAYYLRPLADSQYETHAFTAHQSADG